MLMKHWNYRIFALVVLAPCSSEPATQLSFNLPKTVDGSHPLRVNTDSGSASTNITVGYPVPSLLSFSPQSGMLCAALTLSGSGFYAPVSVTVCNKLASATLVSSSQVRVVVPSGVGDSCPVRLTTPGGTATATQNFLSSQ